MIKRFNRFELKYIVTAAQADAFKRDLLAHMSPDSHGTADGTYDITSLYYDTVDLAFMRAKREGIKFRRKLRIRRYGAGVARPVFVEIKQRINRTTQKRRLGELALDEAFALCAGRCDREFTEEADAAVAGEVLFLAQGLALQPTCVIGYRRTAFVGGAYETGLRVTFDCALWAAPAHFGLDPVMPQYPLAPDTVQIMEVKANDAVPLWLANALARHQCPLRRYSKYCAGAARLGELELLPAVQSSLAQENAYNWRRVADG